MYNLFIKSSSIAGIYVRLQKVTHQCLQNQDENVKRNEPIQSFMGTYF